MEAILLRLDAPLMSFGSPVVGQEGPTQEFPGQSMLTGLLANALGWDHSNGPKLEWLQKSILYAVRCDRQPTRFVDYQTVDLGQPFLRSGWTTWGRAESRGGGSGAGTHIRTRTYLADGIFTVALALSEGPVTVDELEAALREPSRPLFLGRKPCLPAAPLLVGKVEAVSVLAALAEAPLFSTDRKLAENVDSYRAWWPDGIEDESVIESTILSLSDERDWINQIHAGRRYVRHGRIRLREVVQNA